MFCAVFMETHLPTFILIITKNPGQPSNQQNDLWGDLTVKHVKPTCLMVQFFFCSLYALCLSAKPQQLISISHSWTHMLTHMFIVQTWCSRPFHGETTTFHGFSWWSLHGCRPPGFLCCGTLRWAKASLLGCSMSKAAISWANCLSFKTSANSMGKTVVTVILQRFVGLNVVQIDYTYIFA